MYRYIETSFAYNMTCSQDPELEYLCSLILISRIDFFLLKHCKKKKIHFCSLLWLLPFSDTCSILWMYISTLYEKKSKFMVAIFNNIFLLMLILILTGSWMMCWLPGLSSSSWTRVRRTLRLTYSSTRTMDYSSERALWQHTTKILGWAQ